MTEETNALPTGFNLHRYRIEAVLGAGGFGITYKAIHEALQNRVAIKEYFPAEWAYRDHDGVTVRANAQGQIPARLGEPPCYEWGLQRFLDEAKILVQINHPCVVRVRDYFTANGSAYIVMEYEDGESLSTLLQRGGILPEHELRRLIDDVTPALEAVHGQGYLHRDLKPSNLYIRTVDGRVVLIDFGAARQALGRRTRSVTSVVTPGYSPIEQYVTVGEDYGPWTDIYALGAVLYRCITGAPPVEAPGRVLKDPVQPAIECGAGLYSRPLLRVVDQALAVRPEDRFQTVAAMREALRIADNLNEQADFGHVPPLDADLLDLSPSEGELHLDPLPLYAKPPTPSTPPHEDDPWSGTRDMERRSKPSHREPAGPTPRSRPSQRGAEIPSTPSKLLGWTLTGSDTSNPAVPAADIPPAGTGGAGTDASLPLLDNIWEQLDQAPPEVKPAPTTNTLAAISAGQPQPTPPHDDIPQSVVQYLKKPPLTRPSEALFAPDQQSKPSRYISAGRQPPFTPIPPAPEEVLFRTGHQPIHWRPILFAVLAISGLAGTGLLGYGYFQATQEQQRQEQAQKQKEQEEIARYSQEEAKRQEADIADQARKIQGSIAEGNLIAAELSLERMADAYPDHPTVADLRSALLTAQRQGADVKTWTDNKIGIKMVLINGGCFNMGSPPSERDRSGDESSHQVCLKSFWISATEISNTQYRRFKPDYDSKAFQGHLLNRDHQPVVNLSWENAKAFTEWLSWEVGNNKRFRLPTEAEWEYAARARTNTRYYWGHQIDPRYANFSDRNDPSGAAISSLDDGYAVTAPVGSYQPNGNGLHDMAGNVWEWTCSEYDQRYGDQELRCSDRPANEGQRVTRGGSWNNGPGELRSARRLPRKPDYRDAMTGFRVVMEE